MAWNLNSDRPIYAQLMEQIQMQIVSGECPCGSKLPSVREFAAQAGVNPNTMQKAFTELERSGLIVTQRTSGRFVTEDNTMIGAVQRQLAEEQLQIFLESMKKLGFEKEDILELVKAGIEEGNS